MSTVRRLRLVPAMVFALGLGVPAAGAGMLQWLGSASDAENEAIRYSRTSPADVVAQLQQRIDAGATHLQFEPGHGYLRSVLRELNIPIASQVLVFSKTSFERQIISPGHPRAIYFNRDVHVGWVPGGRVLEIASVDPVLGAVFYTMPQEPAGHPLFERQVQACLSCHDSPSYTDGVPGFIMRSVRTDSDGSPIPSADSYLTTDQSPLKERWGGWYVTGGRGSQDGHMGNAAAGASLDLHARVDAHQYLSARSDMVALMVLAHQARVLNLITRAGYRTRMALEFDRIRHHGLGRRPDDVADSTAAIIRDVTEPLVQALLLVGEAPFGAPLAGTSGFSRAFAGEGPRDTEGRSLRELDLTRRLFRYPCSYLIYSASFDALPAPARDAVYRRLWDVLGGHDRSEPFVQLSATDRAAILQILTETKPDFAASRPRRTAS